MIPWESDWKGDVNVWQLPSGATYPGLRNQQPVLIAVSGNLLQVLTPPDKQLHFPRRNTIQRIIICGISEKGEKPVAYLRELSVAISALM